MGLIKNITLFVLITLYSLDVFGQSSFEIVINNERDEYLLSGTKDYDGNYALIGVSKFPNNSGTAYHKGALIMKVDTLGQYITSTLHYPDTNCGLFNVMITNDSNYLFAGYIEPFNADSNQLWLYKTDKLLNKIWEKRFRIPLNSGYTQCSFSSYGVNDDDGNIVYAAFASYYQSNQDDITLIKIDQQGNVITSRQIHYQFSQNITDIITVPYSSDLILVSYHISIIGYQVRMFRLDSALNTISITPISGSDYNYGSMGKVSHWLTDTSFLYCGYIGEGGNPNDDPEIGVSILDTSNHVLSEILLGKPDTVDYAAYINCIDYFNDTTIYIGGFENYMSFWPDEPNSIQVYRLDTALNVLGFNEYGGNAYNRIFGIIASDDGGCLLYGGNYGEVNYHEDDAYVLKVDPSDFIVSTNDNFNQVMNNEVFIYPNPTNENIYFKLPKNYPNNKIRILIYDAFGRKVHESLNSLLQSELCVNCSNLPNGVYHFLVMNNDVRISTGQFIKN